MIAVAPDPGSRHFYISGAEIRKTRWAPFLPALLILPMAAMFGFDASKSQPMHFLMVFSVAILFSAAVVSIGLQGARRQVEAYRKSRLTVNEDTLIWTTGATQTTLERSAITRVTAQKSWGRVRVVELCFADGPSRKLEAYDDMDGLFELLRDNR
jgi:hypothetical protein